MTALPDPAALGFAGDEITGWQRPIKGRQVYFRLLRSLDDLMQAEHLQAEVFGVTDRDIIPANELIVVAETGGAVIAAFLAEEPDHAVAYLIGWGGYVGRPRIVSDSLGVKRHLRGLGLAYELKRLQAAVAIGRGFAEIVWTVDPLRAANARLNFGKLGAVARSYEIDRYGSSFAAELYGGMPTDRLHVTWDIATPRVAALLLGKPAAGERADGSPPPHYVSGLDQQRALIDIPADIDSLVASSPAEALAWRLRLRESLPQAFHEGLRVTGYLAAEGNGNPSLVLERESDSPA